MGKPFKLKCPWGKATRSYPHYQLAKSIGASSIAPPIECRVYDNSRRSQVRGFTCYRLRKRTCLLADQPHQGQSTKKKKIIISDSFASLVLDLLTFVVCCRCALLLPSYACQDLC